MVVSVGGYASLPAALSAVILGVPLVLVNVDAVPGAANRLLGRFARASAVGWEGTSLPRSVVTGTPVRPEITRSRRSPEERRAARIESGSPGSAHRRRLRRLARCPSDQPGRRRLWPPVVRPRADMSIYHVVGRRDWDESPERNGPGPTSTAAGRAVLPPASPTRIGCPLVYAAADIVVCRAGAMTVAELAVVGVPAILVPLPGAPGTTRRANARVLERVGAAVVLPDPSCDGDRLARGPRARCSATRAAGVHGEGGGQHGPARRRRRRGRRGGDSASDPSRARIVGPTARSSEPLRIHVVGAGGAGMSAIATVLAPWATR